MALPAAPEITTIKFTVPGLPVPQGSKRLGLQGRRHVILDDNDVELKAWRNLGGLACNRAMGSRPPLDGPVLVRLTFWMKRPASYRKSARWLSTRPDADKLTRAALDFLHIEGSVITEDSRVVELTVSKRLAINEPGVDIEVVSLDAMERAGVDLVWTYRFVQR